MSSSIPQVFYVQALNIEVEALKAVMTGAPTSSFEYDVQADLPIGLTAARDLMSFQSDAIDINNLVSADLKYCLNYIPDTTVNRDVEVIASDGTTQTVDIPATVLAPDFLAGTTCMSSSGDADTVFENNTKNATNNKVSDDYLRFLAYKLFRTAMGVDLFDNETEVKTDLENTAKYNLHTKLSDLADLTSADGSKWLDKSECEALATIHPTYAVIQQMIDSDPNRFATLVDYQINNPTPDVSGVDTSSPLPSYQAPFQTGDQLVISLLVKADDTQNMIVNDNTISFESNVTGSGGRIYKIVFNVVADEVAAGSGSGGGAGAGP